METLKLDEINAIDQNNTKMQWNMGEATLLTETFIKENKSLADIKHYFFKNNESNVNPFAISFIEKKYEEKFLAQLPEKGEQHITKMFEEQRWEEVCFWFEGIYLQKYSIWECLEKTKPSFFDVIQCCDKTKLYPFLNEIQIYFQATFLESKFLNAQCQLYQSVINCDAKTALSKLFIDSLEILENKLNASSEKTCLLPETDVIHKKHQLFAELVDSFIVDDHDLIPMNALIQKIYKNSVSTFRENGDKVFEITGRQIIWSNINKIFGKNFGEDSISQLRLTAKHLLVLDGNVKLNGKNLSLISPKIIVQNSVTCDLSGADGIKHASQKAENGFAMYKNGGSGKDGADGASSGSMVICASEIVNASNLQIIMNGGQGSNGQDGGDGFDGSNGVGKKFNNAFGFGTKLKLKTAATGNVILGGLPGILGARYKETTQENEVKRLKSFSTHKWPSHSMVVYQGTKGSPGGRGGLNGNGGYGGKKGNLEYLNVPSSQRNIQIEANDGKDGEAGDPGKNGIDGQDGWDVACIKKSFGKLRKYGKFNNEKLEVVFTSEEDEETVYVKSKDIGPGSQCYAKIIAKPLKHATLKDTEEQSTKKKVEKRTLQTKQINTNSVEKAYQKLCKLTSKDKKIDRIMEVSRITDSFEPSIYVPKDAIKPLNTWKDTLTIKKIRFRKSLNEFYKEILLSKNTAEQMNLFQQLIEKLLTFVNAKMLYKCLDLICIENDSIGADFVIAMLANFEVDGCRIDCGTLKYLVEIVFSTLKKNETFKFSSILLSTDQSEWIDTFFLFKIEQALNLQNHEKEMLQESLKNVLDDNLKFVCSRWFRQFQVDFQQLMSAVNAMENVIAPISIVDKTSLTEWPKVLKYSKINSNLSINPEDSYDLKLIKFWCIKLASYFSYEEIEETFKLLSAQEDINSDKENIGRLVHRLCIYDFIADDFNPREDPTVKYLINEVFACYFGIPISSPSETYTAAAEVVEQFRNEISNTTETSHWLENVWEKCCKNVPFEIEKDPSISDSFCDELFEKFIENGEQWDMEDFQNQIAETQKLQWKDFDIGLLKFVSKVISRKFDIHLRINQKIAILTAIRGQYSSGILQQLPTGNGKSLIIVVCSIILTWKRKIVNVVTSSSVLAKRDAHQYSEYYKTFGIKVSHICDESPYIRGERYEANHVLYGDLASFQRDYLLDTFYSMKITNNRPCEIIIVDEVDSMLLDQGANMLYLSHELPDMERLQPLFVKIWQIVHMTKIDMTDDDLYTLIYHTCFPSINMLNMEEILKTTENEVKMLKRKLVESGVIDEDGDILTMDSTEIDLKLDEINEIPPSKIDILRFLFHQLINQERLCIPVHLHAFVKCHLKEFISNAKLAVSMEEGIQYLVDMNFSNTALKYEPRIIIIDQNTGADMPSTQWSNGLQQFLQLKHGLRLTPISLKAVYISSVSYFKKFKQIYGFSGTLGSRKERLQLYDKYYVDLRLVPSTLPKLFYEEPSIITTDKDSHVAEIFSAINKKLSDSRSVLIICKSIKQVDELSTAVTNLAKKEFSGESLLAFVDATLYCRDYEKFEYGEGIELPCKSIIFATNLAGRGTNILLTEELRERGGLHVIVAFLPKNLRIEEQAFGRAARSGDPGSGQLIVCVVKSCCKNPTDILQLKLHRNSQDNHKVEIEYDYYTDKVEVEEKCFEIFTTTFLELKENNGKRDIKKIEKDLIMKDLLDQWALWMDTYPNEVLSPAKRRAAAANSYKSMNEMSLKSFLGNLTSLMSSQFSDDVSVDEYITKAANVEKNFKDSLKPCEFKNAVSEKRFAAAKELCKSLSTKLMLLDKGYYPLTQPSNILTLATNQINKKKYKKAEDRLKWLASNHPIYAAEAKYYLTFIDIKMRTNLTQDKNEKYEQLAQTMKEARSEFDRRMFSSFVDRAIVEFYKETDNHKIFKVDVFSQQQIELSQIACLFIESIDTLVGGRLDAKSFMTPYIQEEASYLLYEHFTDKSNFDQTPIKPTKVCEDYDVQALRDYCQKSDIHFELFQAKIECLKDKEVCESDLISAINLPTAEEFWESLESNDLINPQHHFFLNIIKFETIEPALAEIIKDLIKGESANEDKRLFKHYYVLAENWKEIDVTKMKEKLLQENIDLLCDIGVFCETLSAEVKLKPLHSINFTSFNKLTAENLMAYNIPESSVNEILNSLTNDGILNAVDDSTYILSENLRLPLEEQNLDVQPCFKEVVWKAINKNLAFSIAYQKLQQDLKETRQLRIMLPLCTDYPIIHDLMEHGILERPNVDFIALKSISNVETSILKDVQARCQKAFTSDASFVNVDIAAEIVKQRCRDILKLAIGDEETEVKEYKHITSDIENIYQKFIENTCAQQRFETLDAEMCLLWDVLTECNLVEIRSSSVALNNCLKFLIKFNEKKWSRKTLTKLGLISIAACAQLAIGAAIMLTTAGIGAPISKYFISQGWGDIVYVLKSSYTGYAENYIQHKLISMMMGAIPSTTWIKQLIAPAKRSSNSSIDIAEKLVIKAFKKILFTSINFSIQTVSHTKVDDGIEYVASSIQELIMETIEEEVTNMDQIFRNIFANNEFSTAKELIESNIEELFFARINQLITKICDFTFFHYQDFFIKLDPNMAQSNGKNSSLLDKIIATSIFLHQKTKFSSLRTEMRQKIEKSTEDFESVIQGQNSGASVNALSSVDMDTAVNEIKENFKTQLTKIIKEIVNSRITQPLIALTMSQLQKNLENKVSESFEMFKQNSNDQHILPKNYLFEQYRADKIVEKEKQDIIFFFEEMLEELKKTTKNPITYVQIIMTGIGIDEMACRYIAKVITTKLQINLVIKCSIDESIACPLSDASFETVNLNLTDEAFGKDIKTSRLFDAIRNQIPALTFKDENEFKQVFIEIVKNDHDFLTARRQQFSITENPMTTHDLNGLLNNLSQSLSMFNTISGKAPGSKILF